MCADHVKFGFWGLVREFEGATSAARLRAIMGQDKTAREAALHSMLGKPDRKAVPALIGIIQDGKDYGNVVLAETILGRIGEAGSKAALDFLKRANGASNPDAVRILGGLGGEAAAGDLLRLLKCKNNLVQWAAQRAIVENGEIGERAVPGLFEIFRDKSAAGRIQAGSALLLICQGKKSASPDTSIVEPAIGMAYDMGETTVNRGIAITVLGHIGGENAEKALETLSHDSEVGGSAKRALEIARQQTIGNLSVLVPASLEKGDGSKKRGKRAAI